MTRPPARDTGANALPAEPARERLLDAIIAAEPECVKLLDANGTLQVMNPAGLRMIEADSLDQVLGKSISSLVAETDRAAFDDLTARVFRGESGVLEFRMTGLKGSDRWIETHAAPLYDDAGHITALLGISRDITDRRRSLDALRRQEANFRVLFEQASDGIFVCDAGLRFVDVNSAACELTGFPKDELLALGVPDLVLAEDIARLSGEVARLSSGEVVMSEWGLRRKDGQARIVEVRARQLSDGRLQALARDITDRTEMQARLLQAQKMESIGRLAGGIAHDFNNLLTVISGTAELALTTATADNPLYGDLEQIQLAAARGAALTGQLLTMSRQQILRPEVLQVNDVVIGMEAMLRRLIGEDIALVMTPAGDLGNVRTDRAQLEQIVLNLVLNARDAMPDGGTLDIETRSIHPDAAVPGLPSPGTRGPFVMLAVHDTGIGMNEATRRRIFEPFFTTKAAGKGTGLGLSMVYGAVEQGGGAVAADSAPGGGSVLRIYLPCVGDPLPAGMEAAAADAPGGGETILLVEDEPAIRDVTGRLLKAAGYVVLQAPDGAAALDLLERHGGHIDLLLTDVVMPGINGRELAAQAARTHPFMKVLYMSGYTDDVILRRGLLADPRCFIAKPYTSPQLRQKIRDVLDS